MLGLLSQVSGTDSPLDDTLVVFSEDVAPIGAFAASAAGSDCAACPGSPVVRGDIVAGVP